MFKKVLIANRGEIAVRVAATLKQMGIAVAAVYSDPDRSALHVRSADEAHHLEGNTSAETYLRGDKILDIARRNGVDAIHPGYGFLSENAAFAQACADAGITFIGPSPQTMRAVGNKITAKETLKKAGVPTVPGWTGDPNTDIASIAKEAKAIGFPVMVKAAAGGGGKGMRLVENEADLPQAIESASREAGSAFGDSRIFLEKYIARARHIEIQIFGDSHGNAVYLFERECSIQRRHQKIVEESPSMAVSPDLRRRMGEAAVKTAKAVGYANAGTVEFLVDDAGNFYFLEVNARLQVEHPVTETVTGYDLVRAQLLVASGERLPFTQESLTQTGHAMEVRVYAEDASKGFLPSIGKLEHYVPPCGPNIRVDTGVVEGDTVSIYYDPMLAKLIAWGRDREETLARLDWALSNFVVLGVTTNIDFLRALIQDSAFRAGKIYTQFLADHPIHVHSPAEIPDEALIAAMLAGRSLSSTSSTIGNGKFGDVRDASPWRRLPAWRGV